MVEKKVSIVLPVYNGERFLSQAIESVISQQYTNWELIIVNDCSTDSSLKIMEEYAARDSRIRVLNNARNLKLPNSLNVGFREATGDYFSWTSDDNIMKPEMLKRLVEELDKDEEYGLVYSDHDDIDEEGNITCTRALLEPKDMGVWGNVCGASFLYRRSTAELVGEYDPDLFLAEDYDYWMRLYSKSKIKHLPDILYSCRRHAKSLSSTRKEQIKTQTFRAVMKNHWELLEKCDTSKDRMNLLELEYRLSSEHDTVKMLEMAKTMNAWRHKTIVRRTIDKCKQITKRIIGWDKRKEARVSN